MIREIILEKTCYKKACRVSSFCC